MGHAGPSDAAVLRPTHSFRGAAIGHGFNPLLADTIRAIWPC